MSKITDLIAKYCPNGVEYKKLIEVSQILNGFAFQSSKYTNSGIRIIRISDVQKGRISDKDIKYYPFDAETEIKNYLLHENDLVMSLTGNVGRVAMLSKEELPAALNQRVACVRPLENMLLTRFLFHIFDTNSFEQEAMKNSSGGGQKNLSTKWLYNYSIPIPPLSVQQEIVRILDGFSELEKELEKELDARKKQYEHYKDNLLSFDVSIQKSKLIDCCDYVDYRGKTPKKTDKGIFLITAKNIKKGFIDYKTSTEYIAEEDFATVMRRGKVELGDVLITTEAPCGNVAQIDRTDVALAQRVIKYRPKNQNLDTAYLKYILLSKQFQDELKQNSSGGTVKGIKGSKLHQIKIPIPPLEEQKRIVSILDKFDALVNDISVGLPAELKARRKQYEYWRNKLLDFKEAV